MSSGWIKLHRSLTDWEWYDDINVSRLFIHLLLTVNHKDKNWRGITIKKGSRLTSLDKLSVETKLSVSKIRTAIKKLILTNEIASKSHSQHTVFTVINYNQYQRVDKPIDKPVADESQTDDKRMTTNKNVKNEKKERKEILYSENLDEQFEILWGAKGKKGSKKKAYEVFKKLAKGSNNETVFNFTNILCQDLFKKQHEPGYQERMLTTYLNGEFWEQ